MRYIAYILTRSPFLHNDIYSNVYDVFDILKYK